MKTILLFLILAPLWAYAEGIPKDDNGNLDYPHLTISLNESQVEEMEVLDSVTLTAKQWKAVRGKAPNTPKRLQGILPITHNDCTCGESYAAVLLANKKIAVYLEEQDINGLASRFSYQKNLTFHVDHRGQFYFNGILTRYPNLIAALKNSPVAPARTEDDAKWIQVGRASIETPLLMSPTSPVFAARVREVGHLLKSKGWSIGGVSYHALNAES